MCIVYLSHKLHSPLPSDDTLAASFLNIAAPQKYQDDELQPNTLYEHQYLSIIIEVKTDAYLNTSFYYSLSVKPENKKKIR